MIIKFAIKGILIITTVSVAVVIVALVVLGPNKLISIYNKTRPHLITGGGETCLTELSNRGVTFTSLGDRLTDACLVKDAVQVSEFSLTKINAPVTLNCNTALKLDKWLNEMKAYNVEHFGAYNCRAMRGSPIMSEHSFGNAIDIAAINGVSVLSDWNSQGSKSDFIKSAAEKACDYFSNVITPAHNELHRDHLHLDRGYGTTCLPSAVQYLERLTIHAVASFL